MLSKVCYTEHGNTPLGARHWRGRRRRRRRRRRRYWALISKMRFV